MQGTGQWVEKWDPGTVDRDMSEDSGRLKTLSSILIWFFCPRRDGIFIYPGSEYTDQIGSYSYNLISNKNEHAL